MSQSKYKFFSKTQKIDTQTCIKILTKNRSQRFLSTILSTFKTKHEKFSSYNKQTTNNQKRINKIKMPKYIIINNNDLFVKGRSVTSNVMIEAMSHGHSCELFRTDIGRAEQGEVAGVDANFPPLILQLFSSCLFAFLSNSVSTKIRLH